MEPHRLFELLIPLARQMTSKRWRKRLVILALVMVAHWIAFGTFPASPKRVAQGVRPQRTQMSSITINLLPLSTLKAIDALAKPIAEKPAAPTKQTAKVTATTSESVPPEPAQDEFLGVAGMLDDEAPIVLGTPEPIRLQYAGRGVVQGQPMTFGAELLWKHDGRIYEARMEMGDPVASPRTLTSQGQLTDIGLQPIRFEDNTVGDSAAQFDQVAGKVRFGGQAGAVDLTPGAQDQLSVFIQLAAIFLGNANRLPAGSTLAFQTIGARSSARWAFNVVNSELFYYPAGPINAIHLTLDTWIDQDTTLDLWIAPETGYLPLRIRLSHRNGSFVEQEWQPTGTP